MLVLTVTAAHAQSAAELKVIRQKLSSGTRDTTRVNALLDLGRYYLNKPGEFANDLDSALLLNNQARQLSTALKFKKGAGNTILLEGQVYREKNQLSKAWNLTQQALAFFTKENMPAEMGESNLVLASFFNNDDNELDKKIRYTETALPLLEKAGSKKNLATTLQDLGDYYQIKGEWAKSIKLLERSLAIYQSIHFKDLQGIYNLIGYVYRRNGKDILALKYGLLAVKTAEALSDTSMQLCTIYNRLAITYYGLEKNTLAYKYYSLAYDVASKYKNADAMQQIGVNQAVLLRRMKQPQQSLKKLINLVKTNTAADKDFDIAMASQFANVYMDMKQYDKARRYVDSLISLQKRYPHELNYGVVLNKGTIRYYIETGQYASSYPYLQKNDSLIHISHKIFDRADNELYWAKVDSGMGNMAAALKHYQVYKTYSDSINGEKLKKQLDELQFQFDIDHKDQHIAFLTQQSQLQQNRIRLESVVRKIIFGSLIALLAFCGLLYNRYRLKKRSNDIMASKQAEINSQNELLKNVLSEKEWLLKEIHHRVKNNLQIVISLLNTQSAYLENEDALSAIRNSQHRMHAMSLIHQKLYLSENLATIDIANYIRELVDYLQESFDTERRITYIMDLDPLKIDVAQAVPLGLILNEAISNAIKYAFAKDGKGKITISLKPEGADYYQLSIADNGKGLPEGFDPDESSSLGMSLMQGLALQLEGSFRLNDNNGLNVCIIFRNQSIGDMKKTS